MRQCDWLEITAASPDPVHDILAKAMWMSPDPVAAVDPELGLLALFGYAPVSSTHATLWLLGTNALNLRHGELARSGRVYIAQVLTLYPHLFNYVDTRNAPSKAYLRRLGFTLQPAAPFGHKGLPFHRFDKEA